MRTERYLRQWDLVPLQRLREERIALIGVGAIGRQVALQLATMGASWLLLSDPDTVEEVNVGVQAYRPDQIGLTKTEATAADIAKISDSVSVLQKREFEENFLRETDITTLFCCVDTISAREMIFKSAARYNVAWLDGRMLGNTIRVLAAYDAKDRQYYRSTLFSQEEQQVGRCTARATIYTANIAAGLMINLFVRHLRGLPVIRDIVLDLNELDLIIQDRDCSSK